jgi:hypothetical protein
MQCLCLQYGSIFYDARPMSLDWHLVYDTFIVFVVVVITKPLICILDDLHYSKMFAMPTKMFTVFLQKEMTAIMHFYSIAYPTQSCFAGQKSKSFEHTFRFYILFAIQVLTTKFAQF